MAYLGQLTLVRSFTYYQRSLSVLLVRGISQAHALNSDIVLRPIEKVLIANRGEIACRVIRTARKLGIQTVAVYSDVDRHAMHVEMADEAYHIGSASSQESYLNSNKILQVAKKSGSQAVHPGYGFLSENLEFSEKCKTEGIIFVGPPSTAIRDMGIKSTSKAIMSAAGVPIIEGYHGEDQSIDKLRTEASRIGFPLMIKAVRGGGGKGMRIAQTEKEFLNALDSAKRESLKAFGDDNVLLENYVSEPRHVEVQVFADMHGNAVHLFERDCSVQRRHQKIIEEAPAPGLSTETRLKLGAAAVRAAKAVGYVGAGTVEFILNRKTHSFHFMEMNTRLQVEHPITEMITGTDLVEWQLRVASGEPLPVTQSDITMSGHAFESRIYAEDPRGGFLPGAGPLKHMSLPDDASYVRVETGAREGDEVSVHYDPMIAKLVVWGKDRREALSRMRSKLADYQIVGLETNVNFLLDLCRNKSFQNGDVHTGFIDEHKTDLFPENELPQSTVIQAALAKVLFEKHKCEVQLDHESKGIRVPQISWRPNYYHKKKVLLTHNKKDLSVEICYGESPNTFTVRTFEGNWLNVEASLLKYKNQLVLKTTIDGVKSRSNIVVMGDSVYLFDKDGKKVLDLVKPQFLLDLSKESSSAVDLNSARSPMPGILDKMFTKVNMSVKKGDPLFVIIAMKMEYVVRAPRDGTVTEVTQSKIGDSIPKNSVLVRFKLENAE